MLYQHPWSSASRQRLPCLCGASTGCVRCASASGQVHRASACCDRDTYASGRRGNPLVRQLFHYVKENGLTLNHQNRISSLTIYRRKSLIFFDTIRSYIEKKMEQFNSTKLNSETIIHKYRIGPMIDGKLVWLQEEDPNEDISIALIIWEQFFTSVLFKQSH